MINTRSHYRSLARRDRRLAGMYGGRLGSLRDLDNQSADFNQYDWSDAQKVVASMNAQAVDEMPPFLHPDLTSFLPPIDAQPFIIPAPSFPVYPAPGAAATPILGYQAPQGMIAIVNKIAIVHVGGNPPDGSGNVIWSVTINGAGVKGLGQLTSEVGTMAAPNDTIILLIDGDTLQISVSVPATGVVQPGTTAARIHGWTYPLSEATLPQSVTG